MLLPQLSETAAAFVAVNDVSELVVGAAAAARLLRTQPLMGPGVALHVIEPCRGRDVGGQLLKALERTLQKTNARALYAAKRVDLTSDEMRDWEQLGFTPCETVEEHILPVANIAARLVPLLERMRSRIPAKASVVPLYKADYIAVLKFHLDQMGGDRAELTRKLKGHGSGAFLPRQSRVLLVDNQVKGCLLASRLTKETIVVDANIVEPSLRGGWANAWLKLEAFQGSPPGVTGFSFKSFDHYTDTRSFTRKLGGRTVRTTALMYRPIPPTATSGK
jgi:N-acetylglutamate synthase-like GNAT family acetyltransferase